MREHRITFRSVATLGVPGVAFVCLLTVVVYTLMTLSSWGGASYGPMAQLIQTKLSEKSHKSLSSFYKGHNFNGVWSLETGVNPKAKGIVSIIKECETEGLNPQDYNEIFQAYDKLNSQDMNERADAEIEFTQGVWKYIDHLRNGRFMPKTLDIQSPAINTTTDPGDVIDELIKHDANVEMISDLAPDIPLYRQLRTLLAQLKALEQEFPDLPKIKSGLLKKGVENEDVAKLRRILLVYGDMSKQNANEPNKFDADVEKGVKIFQARHILKPTGVIDKETRDILNWSIRDRINRVLINMERLRWYPDFFGKRYVFVNIPSYEVVALEGSDYKFMIPAIVGHPTRRTPLFNSRIVSIVVNPSWGVPDSIFLKDKLPRIIEDPEYVSRAGFTVTNNRGQVVDPSSVDWENEGGSYRLRQSPGKHNALGELRFTLEDYSRLGSGSNKFGVYMHGTPEVNLFKNARRAFSSGCVRLKYPRKMALWLLEDNLSWDEDGLKSAINKGGTKVIPLTEEHKAQVYLSYFTVTMGPLPEVDNKDISGELNSTIFVRFGHDPYGYDLPLMKKMGLLDTPKKSNS